MLPIGNDVFEFEFIPVIVPFILDIIILVRVIGTCNARVHRRGEAGNFGKGAQPREMVKAPYAEK